MTPGHGDCERNGQVSPAKAYRPFLLVVLFLSLYLAYLILKPFLDILAIAIVMASMFYPLQLHLNRILKGRPTLAALIIVFIVTFVLVIPILLFTSELVTQGVDSVNRINEWVRAGSFQKLMEDPRVLSLSQWVEERFPHMNIDEVQIQNDLISVSKDLGQFLLSKGAAILGNVASLISRFFILIFVVFFLVRDGAQMVATGRYYSPLRQDQEDRILSGIRVVAKSVLLGTFLTALCQGIVGGIGLTIVGIPGLFWGTVMGFASLIPIIGTALVWVPAVVYLVLLGEMKLAAFLAAWCILLVGSIDNFLRPFLMRGEAKMSPFYVFLAIVGGVQYFGLTGILYGPLILSFAMIMLYIYGVEYEDDLLLRDKGLLPATHEGQTTVPHSVCDDSCKRGPTEQGEQQ
jgi:predicted PurR-regulated permease PerM